MNITIQERAFSLGVEYDIQTPHQRLSALKKIFAMKPHIVLQDENDELLSTIQGESFFRTKFAITLQAGETYDYHCEKIWKSVDICEGLGDTYHLYTHRGLRYSIYKGDQQIAALSTNHFIVGNGRRFDLQVNSTVDLALITSMVLCLNTEDSDDRTNDTFTYDLGSIGPEDRRFDESWQPDDAAGK